MDINSLYKQPVVKYSSFEDSSFIASDSPVILDVYTALARDIYNGEINCDGAGDIEIEISADGTTYGNATTLKANETADLTQYKIRKVKITHTGTDSSYRCRFW